MIFLRKVVLKGLAVVFFSGAIALVGFGMYATITYNWDVPAAMVTPHQSWDAFMALLPPAAGALIVALVGGMLWVAADERMASKRRTL